MAKQWRCFYCDEVFKTRKGAWLHFGEGTPCRPEVPACVSPLRTDEAARLKELREAERHALELQRRAEKAEECADRLARFEADLPKYFGKGCYSLWTAGDRYKNALYRIKDLEKQIDKG